MLSTSLSAADITGFWRTLNDKTGKSESVIAIYRYKDSYYGRIIASYEPDGQMIDTIYTPQSRAPGVVGNPYYSGLDIIWGVRQVGSRYKGKILDPRQGKIYDAELWTRNGNLIVRGEVLFIGKNITWPPARKQDFPKKFKKPDLKTFVPTIPRPA